MRCGQRGTVIVKIICHDIGIILHGQDVARELVGVAARIDAHRASIDAEPAFHKRFRAVYADSVRQNAQGVGFGLLVHDATSRPSGLS